MNVVPESIHRFEYVCVCSEQIPAYSVELVSHHAEASSVGDQKA